MKNSEIKDLLIRFYKGQTSAEEESRLKEFFKNGEIDDSFLDDKAVFEALNELGGEIAVPEKLERNLSELVESLDRQSQKRRMPRWLSYAAAAAVAAVICVVAFLPHRIPQDIFTANVEMTEAEAIAKFEKSIALLSKGFEISCSTARKADETLEKTINTVVNSVK